MLLDWICHYDNLACFDESSVPPADCLTTQVPESELLLGLQFCVVGVDIDGSAPDRFGSLEDGVALLD